MKRVKHSSILLLQDMLRTVEKNLQVDNNEMPGVGGGGGRNLIELCSPMLALVLSRTIPIQLSHGIS